MHRITVPYSVADLVPHAGAMLLLDRVLTVGELYAEAEVTIRPDTLFADPSGVPAWIGIEYMAQTIAAFSGHRRKQRGEPIDLGFLLGTRHYQCSVDRFPPGSVLQVRAECEIEAANGLSVFACSIAGSDLRADAKLNVFLPADSRPYLDEKRP